MIDIAIVGGGPAGAAAAIEAARGGRSAIVFDRPERRTFLLGETFPPALHQVLGRLGVERRFDDCPRVESMGVLSAWGSAALGVQDYLARPAGRGWHVERRAFNQMLLAAVRAAGVEVVEVERGSIAKRENDGSWMTPKGKARFLIDSSGRSGEFALPEAGRRVPCDAMLSLARQWRAGSGEVEYGAWALIEACESGWCYSAPQPEGGLITCFHADAAWFREQSRDWDYAWKGLIANGLPFTARRLRGARERSQWRVAAAGPARRERFAGAGWAAAGDAASARDPLSGAGVLRALRDGIRAAEAAGRELAGDGTATRELQERQAAEWQHHLQRRAWYYRREQRWGHATFWSARRKHAARLILQSS
jgi:flavin-dependent dehydrogenase